MTQTDTQTDPGADRDLVLSGIYSYGWDAEQIAQAAGLSLERTRAAMRELANPVRATVLPDISAAVRLLDEALSLYADQAHAQAMDRTLAAANCLREAIEDLQEAEHE